MERLTSLEIFTRVMAQFTPVWIALAVILVVSWIFRRKLGLYGKLYASPIGIAGLILVLFWVLTAIFADLIACLLYTSPSPRDRTRSRMPSSA